MYESTSHYDPETGKSRPQRKYLGSLDPETNELIPSTGRRGRKPGGAKSDVSGEEVLLEARISSLEQTIAYKEAKISDLKSEIADLKGKILEYEKICDSLSTLLSSLPEKEQ